MSTVLLPFGYLRLPTALAQQAHMSLLCPPALGFNFEEAWLVFVKVLVVTVDLVTSAQPCSVLSGLL